jgi:hypothetical protein
MRALCSLTSLALLSLMAGCSAEPDTSEATVELGDDGKADSASELYVRVSDTSLWVDGALTRSGSTFVLHGRSSRNLTWGNAFIADDAYGAFEQVGARSFTVSWSASEAPMLISGVNQFIGFNFAHSASRPDALTARVVVRPRLLAVRGTGGSFTGEILPVLRAGGKIAYRASGTGSKKLLGVTTSSGTATVDDDSHFHVDWSAAELLALAGTGKDVTLELREEDGPHTKRAQLGLAVKKLGLTAADAYTTWPAPSCTAAPRACLASLPANAADYGKCGEALVIQACLKAGGARVDAAALAAAHARLETRLGDPAGFAADAVGLVGAGHGADFTTTVRAAVGAKLDALNGSVYDSAPARDAALDAALEAALLSAYARPLDYVARWEPLPNDQVRARQVAGDELLTWLATHDLTQTEWGRPLEALVGEFRARHVDSIRAMRETSEIFVDGANDIYLGDYLGGGPHVEVTIERATGKVLNMLFEID